MKREETDRKILEELSERAKEIRAEIQELEEENERLRDDLDRLENNEDNESLGRYDEMLDECYEEFKIGNMTYSPSRVFRAVDEIAYNYGYDEFADSEITDLKSRIDDLQDEIDTKQKEINDLLGGKDE